MNDQFEHDYARYVGDEMRPREREDFERRVLSDPDLSEEVYADLDLAAKLAPASVVRRPAKWWRWAAPLAAAALVLLALNLRQPAPPQHVMRGDAGGIETLAPVGEVAAVPVRFEWAPVEGATRYRFELLDATAAVVARQVVTTTSVTLESGVPASGAWRIVATNDLGEVIASSTPVEFRVVD